MVGQKRPGTELSWLSSLRQTDRQAGREADRQTNIAVALCPTEDKQIGLSKKVQ